MVKGALSVNTNKIDIMSVAEDVIITIAIDSVQAGKIKVNQAELIEVGIVSAGFMMLGKNMALLQLSSLISDPGLLESFTNILGKSLVTILYRMVMKKSYKVKDVVMRWALIELAEMLFEKFMVTEPANKRQV